MGVTTAVCIRGSIADRVGREKRIVFHEQLEKDAIDWPHGRRFR
jgi:hypothetical protein